jgi:hypothetical protein
MSINKKTFAEALRAINSEGAKAIDDLPDKKWRRAYAKNVVEQVRQCATKPENAISVAKAGLDYLHKNMVFVRPAGGETHTLEEAMAKYTGKKFQTYEIQGKAPRAEEYTVQYKKFGAPGPIKELSGDVLRKQIETWVRTGAIETSCGTAMTKVVDNSEWTDLRDCYFVLFGASSAMGPFFKLMDHGANIIALDLDRPAIWEKLIKDTRCRAGKLIFPVKEAIPAGASDEDIAKVAGCNLLVDTPEIRTWLTDLYPKERFVCMALAYLDGALFVKVSMAMDAIIASLIEKRGADKMGVAYLCTPTDAHLCTAASVDAAKSNFNKSPVWLKLLAQIINLAGLPMKRNVEKPILDANGNAIDGIHVVDCIIPEQGPNYILAKRLQHWRAMVSREQGVIASSNIAPSTATASVLSNVMFALSYKGFPSIRPMEITFQETSNSVMAALLIRDIRDPTSASNPKTPLKNPLCLFGDAAWHGGCWRTGYKFSSNGAPAFASYGFSAFVIAPYLLFYSLYQSYGWARIMSTVLTTGFSTSIWSQAGPTCYFFQHLGLMEVLHGALGLTRSNAFMTFVQIYSRILVIAMIVENPSFVKADSIFIPCMLFAWSMADFTRYFYHTIGQVIEIATSIRGVAGALKLMKVGPVHKADDPVFDYPFPLVWLRYSMFIVLYPMGIFCELNVFRMTFSAVTAPMSTTTLGTISSWIMQTTKLMVGGSSWFWFASLAVSYAAGGPALMSMLLAARKKKLAPPPKTKVDAAKKGN